MLDGESIIQADRDVVVVRQETHGIGYRAVAIWCIVNMLWAGFVVGAFSLGQHTAKADIREIVAEEVPGIVRVVLMP